MATKINRGKVSSVGDLILRAGVRAAQYAVDTDECLFCTLWADEHEEHCTFHGRTHEDLLRMLAALAAGVGVVLPEPTPHPKPGLTASVKKPKKKWRCSFKRDCPTGKNHRHACTLTEGHEGEHVFVEPCEGLK